MNTTKVLVSTLVAGGIAAFALDPFNGRRRRALLKDKATKILRVKQDALDVMVEDFNNRLRGSLHLLRERIFQTPVEDPVLEERIRSSLGRVSTHPGPIQVESKHGHITLRGDVLASEIQEIVQSIKKLHGVKSVTNLLEIHSSPDDIPSLQGTGPSRPTPSRWTPATALIMSGAGALLAAIGLARRDRVGGALSTAGMMLVLKSFADVEARFAPAGADSFAYALQHPARGTRRASQEGRTEILKNQ